MTRLDDLVAMRALFIEAAALNREALAALRSGQPLQSLQSTFERKAAVGTQLQALQGELGQTPIEGAQEALQAAFQAQREAATTEAQLAEALGTIVPQGGKAAQAYGSFGLAKGTPKLDSSV